LNYCGKEDRKIPNFLVSEFEELCEPGVEIEVTIIEEGTIDF